MNHFSQRRNHDLALLMSEVVADGHEEGPSLTSEPADDPWSAPTAEAVPERQRAEALEAFTEGRKALGQGDLARAANLMLRAAQLDPTDPRYPSYVEQVAEEERRRKHPEAAPPPAASRAAPRAGRMHTFLVAGAMLAVFAAAWLGTRPQGTAALPDQAAAHQQVAPFTRLTLAPGGGWTGTIDEPLATLDPDARTARCLAILRALPAAEDPTLLLRSTDGQALACRL